MQSYEQALRLFSVWLGENFNITHIEGVTDYHMRRFIIDLQTRGKYTFCSVKGMEEINHPQNRRDYNLPISNTIINNYLRNLRAFFAWLVDMEYLTRTPMKKFKLLSGDRRALARMTQKRPGVHLRGVWFMGYSMWTQPSRKLRYAVSPT